MGFVFFLLHATQLSAQEPDPEDAPPIVQGSEHFYNAVGRGVTVEWSADRTEVAAGGDIVATLTVRGATNPHRVRRPNLRDVRAFADRFQIADGDDPPSAAGAKEVRFTYRLRPRLETVDSVPELPFAYYNPASKKVQTTYARKLPIRVRPAPAPPAEPLVAPERFFTLADDYAVPSSPGLFGGLACILAVPTAVAVWVVLWRLRNPDGVRLARLRRNRAVAKALDGLKRAGKTADPAASAAAAVRVYLVERWGMPPAAAVPGEVAAVLEDTELSGERAGQAVDFLKQCDAARFAPEGDDGASLVAEGREMILRWEDSA